MGDDNISLQADEIEALSSIYGEDWCVLNEAARTYCIEIKNEVSEMSLNLQIQMPSDYPSSAPPQYQLSAPWLRGKDRAAIQNVLEEIYLENIGESLVYLWVEKIREILAEQTHDEEDSKDTSTLPALSELSVAEESDNTSLSYATTSEKEESFNYDFKYEPKDKDTKNNRDVCPEIFHGDPIFDRKSTFQGHVARVMDKKEVDLVMEELLQNKKIAAATHNIQAYRILKENPRHIYITGCEDDGEIHAGSRVLHLLEMMNAVNVLVVITRWYGGIHLGPDRFKHINNCARELLEKHGFRQDGDEKKGPRSNKKK